MNEKNPLTLPDLRDYVAQGKHEDLRAFCESTPPPMAAEILAELNPHEIWGVIQHGSVESQALVLSHLEPEIQEAAAREVPVEDLAHIVDAMASDDRVDLLKRLPEAFRLSVLHLVSSVERADIMRLSTYREGTCGAIMTSEFATVPADHTAAQAIDLLRRVAGKKETIYYTYVIDEVGRLLGFVSLKSLIRSAPGVVVKDIMKSNMFYVRAEESQEEALYIMQRFDLIALPVINGGDRLVGIITVDDVLDVGEEEATADFHKMATVGTISGGLLGASFWVLYRARVPWLMLLVFMNVFSGAGIAYFEDTIEAVVALVFFLPLLIDSGGNAGAQAATLMVRAMATGDVAMRDWYRLLLKEISICLALGFTMAIAVTSIAAIRAPEVMVPVGLTMIATVVLGSLIGTVLPFIFTKLKLDPATASGPLVTSLADIGGVLIYFAIASWYLGL